MAGQEERGTASWEETASAKREACAAKIPSAWRLPESLLSQISETSNISVMHFPRESGILSEKELDITENYNATELVEMMSAGRLASIDVVTAFCKRAAIAQQCLSCLTEILFDEALVQARQCDEYLAREVKPMGPLHGLPVSLKDSFNIKGVQATIGYTSFCANPPAESDSVLVDILRKAGAVFYVKTNIPQTMMSADSHNNIFGRTLNPHKLSLTAGGSSGGEGALLAMKGSVLGVGTDIGGSVRVPALCCGIGSVKSTTGRLPFGNKVSPGRNGSPGAIAPAIGPLGRSVRDYDLFMKTIIHPQLWLSDEGVINVPWRTVAPLTRPLRFGLVQGCKERPLHPPIARALHQVAELLKSHGHEVVLIDDNVPDLYQTALLSWEYFLLDEKQVWMEFIMASGEPMIPSLPGSTFKEMVSFQPSLDKLWGTNLARGKTLRAWREAFAGERLDAVLSCGYQATAVPHDTYGVPVYTVLQNLLHFPAGILPFGKASKELDASFVQEGAAYEPPCECFPSSSL